MTGIYPSTLRQDNLGTMYRRLAAALEHAALLYRETAELLDTQPSCLAGGPHLTREAAAVADTAATLTREALRISASLGRTARPRVLTARELAVAHLISLGLRDREIATKLGMSLRTAQSHADHIYRKLGIHNRAQLAAWYITNVEVARTRPRRNHLQVARAG
ncbi:MAG TPA: LuxR C-terminal-related transcriptional regulator [Rugosimonospora sp.]|nr:LuxR C-terminal-related transcriptional regulator [Rugosimonospora sp.]